MTRVRIHTNPFHFYKQLPGADLNDLFLDFDGKIDLEIGVGQGYFLTSFAKANPKKSMIGVEIRKPWVEKVLGDI
ncbi:MAG: tRNA (guanosine(46)-N7)-methyltransferase TrmB, partial [Candidatus Margulisiibacteriota bacterium]